jgi:hypothetical protein
MRLDTFLAIIFSAMLFLLFISIIKDIIQEYILDRISKRQK